MHANHVGDTGNALLVPSRLKVWLDASPQNLPTMVVPKAPAQGLLPGAVIGIITGALVGAFLGMPWVADGMDEMLPILLGAVVGVGIGAIGGVMLSVHLAHLWAARTAMALRELDQFPTTKGV